MINRNACFIFSLFTWSRNTVRELYCSTKYVLISFVGVVTVFVVVVIVVVGVSVRRLLYFGLLRNWILGC
jgi:uncharacterized membrane protein YcjF (UPF0283 family)